jgi:hypothetical protein
MSEGPVPKSAPCGPTTSSALCNMIVCCTTWLQEQLALVRHQLKQAKTTQQPELQTPRPPGSGATSIRNSDHEQASAAAAESEQALAAARGREQRLRERLAQLEQEVSRAKKVAHAGAQPYVSWASKSACWWGGSSNLSVEVPEAFVLPSDVCYCSRRGAGKGAGCVG